jgi:predicted O-methyltransferase YrrM
MASISPYFRPSAYISKLRQLWYRISYDVVEVSAVEAEKFAAAGFDRAKALGELDAHLNAMGLPGYAQCQGMASVHWLLFACLSQRAHPRRILEIGTYDGQTTALLARLFPQSQITTVELPASDPILHQTYGRGDQAELAKFEQTLAANTAAPNITLLKINSFFVPGVITPSLDLIWIDGGHLYPEIAWDLCNAYHLLGNGGYLMCDDVLMDPKGVRDDYVSPDSHNVLQYICVRTGDPLQLFLKRESPVESADPHTRKYVALLQKKHPGGSPA